MTDTTRTLKPGEAIQRAQALTREGRMGDAEAAWRAALEQFPESLAAVTGLVKVLDAREARHEAETILRAFIAAAPLPNNIQAAARLWEQWQDRPAQNARTVRIALAGTGTLNPLGAYLRVACGQAGLHPAVFVGDFNQWAQDLLAPESALYQFGPEMIALLLEPAALFPQTVSNFECSSLESEAERIAGIEQIAKLLAAVRHYAPAATVILHTFAVPDYSPLGILDLAAENGQRERIEQINRAVVALARAQAPQVVLFDQERVEARHGKARVRDERLWYMASMPFSDSFLPVMMGEYLRLIRAVKGLTRKCIVLDLDNTLWGGVIGEDGIHQIKLGGSSAPGNAFYDFQQALVALKRRGVLLALASKNNPDDVWPVLDRHPAMLLRREDFAAVRLNWQDKATNIAEIARELNIGLESLVFLDDNPAERGLVRQQLPEVMTVELPRDPAYYTQALLALDVFETLSLTQEDRRRSELYQEQQAREQHRIRTNEGADVTDYLAGLQMKVKIEPATAFSLPRIAQLINKTNQFNLTTRRYTETQVQGMADAPEQWGIYSVSVSDRFGDSGLTGVAILHKGDSVWEIDSFLLSCRVLGRGIEQALLKYLADHAQQAGAAEIRGHFLPTAKNAPAADFYERMGLRTEKADASAWTLTLRDLPASLCYPMWLDVEKNQEENQ